MKKLLIFNQFITALSLLINPLCIFVNVSHGQTIEPILEPPLFLTPLINSGAIDEAKAAAKVKPLPHSDGIPQRDSYSGFITINEEYNSNLFFWFFPAINNVEVAPIILWLDGGPGVSNFISVFSHNGPYIFGTLGALEERVADWTLNHSMIYLENPVGTGFSFTNDPRGYANTSEEAANNTLDFLAQFFQLFPEYSTDPFYVAGESYGGHFAPPVMSALHRQNQAIRTGGGAGVDQKRRLVNLKGLFLLAPWTHPFLQSQHYGDYLYGVGLIDNSTKAYFKEEEAKIQSLIENGDFLQAKDTMTRLLVNPDSTFTNTTGFTNNGNLLNDRLDLSVYRWGEYVVTPEFRSAVHVGNTTYDLVSSDVQASMGNEFMDSKLHYVEELLNATEGYQVLFVSAQLDMSALYASVEAMLQALNWDGAGEYKEAPRSIWRSTSSDKGEVAGYIKKARNLTHVLMRNAGHFLIADQQDWSLELVNWLKIDGAQS